MGHPKGQIISKAIYGLLTSPKKRTDEFDLFAFLLFTANKSNSSVCVLGESTARKSTFWFALTYIYAQIDSSIYNSFDLLIFIIEFDDWNSKIVLTFLFIGKWSVAIEWVLFASSTSRLDPSFFLAPFSRRKETSWSWLLPWDQFM